MGDGEKGENGGMGKMSEKDTGCAMKINKRKIGCN
jgi:hypothetical protein